MTSFFSLDVNYLAKNGNVATSSPTSQHRDTGAFYTRKIFRAGHVAVPGPKRGTFDSAPDGAEQGLASSASSLHHLLSGTQNLSLEVLQTGHAFTTLMT